MGLGLNTGGDGDFAAIVKYDAKAARWFRMDREQVGGAWETSNVDITQAFQAVFDMENIEVGWVHFAGGQAPSWCMVPFGSPFPDRPTDKHKQAFRMTVLLGKSCGGDLREFAAQAKVVIGALDTLHDAYTAGLKANAGKLPVVRMTGATPIVSKSGAQSFTNYAPVLEITSWVGRPKDLGGEGSDSGGGAPANPPAPPPKEERIPADAEF